MKSLLSLLSLVGVASTLAFGAHAQTASDYPSSPATVVYPFDPGGVNVTPNRIVADYLTKKLGQPYVVEYKAGAGGMIATSFVANSPADGYTILYHNSALTSVQAFRKEATYDIERDLTPVAGLWGGVMGLFVNAELPINTFEEFIAYAKENPNELTFGTTGIGTSPHLIAEALWLASDVKIRHIPYGGGGAQVSAALANEINSLIIDVSFMKPHVESGKMRLLAVGSAEPTPLAPGIPTISEIIGKEFTMTYWSGYFVPKETPADVVETLSEAILSAADDPEARASIEGLGFVMRPESGEVFSKTVFKELEGFNNTIEEASVPRQ